MSSCDDERSHHCCPSAITIFHAVVLSVFANAIKSVSYAVNANMIFMIMNSNVQNVGTNSELRMKKNKNVL
jgi:hypothetical protein